MGSTRHPDPVPKIATQSETWKSIYLDDETNLQETVAMSSHSSVRSK